MSEALTASERIAACFGIEAARALVIRPLREATLSVVHLGHFYENGDHPVLLPPDDAFLVMLYLVDVYHSDIWPDRPPAPLKRYPKGSICLISMKDGAAISVRGYFEALVFHIPRAHLVELAEEAAEPYVDDLTTCRGIDDQVIRNLGSALMPMFDMPDEVRDTLLPHVGLAFNAHLAHRYGRSPAQRLSTTGRLSPTQEKRIKMYIAANLSGDKSIDDIAEATGFAVDELNFGFVKTTGQSVLEWISACRISRAKSQLSRTGEAIARVAETCGFLDEKTFVEDFTRAVGVTPFEWRSRNRH
ncbi:AraC-type DNA-binding protein [Rhizobium mongolense subsp. loessense]|uniref:AraC-type DNA-binding protein n=1 Tax=Rhizobium mongolense subsp. loessense TaxID=158890 RepID=A0A1G4R0F8_9HYPH|nr:AraC family transcriptional regulator [Rhizobium mongolense]SCW50332.1 AraC-type DNA-binding protein [Rhizobium mongolense subsp. loessense]